MTSILFALPEITVALAAMALLLIGAFRGDKAGGLVTSAAVVSLLAAAALVALGRESGVALYGMFAVDDYRRFVKVMLLIAAAGSLVLAPVFFGGQKSGLKPEYPVLVMLATLGMMLMISAHDWIALYVALELQNLGLYVLTAFQREEKRSSEAGLKYFMLSAFSSAIMLFGLSLLYGFAGGTGFDVMAHTLAQGQAMPIGLVVGLVFVMAGFALKVSAAPFHMWTPDVYEGAPLPVTAFLAAAPKIAALALLAVVLGVPLIAAASVWQPVLMALAVASMALGSFAGLLQKNIKRLMAYSAIANVGTMLVGLAALDPVAGGMSVEGLQGVLIYLAVYFVATLGVFGVVAGLRQGEALVESVDDLAGLSQAHPWLSLVLAAMLFSLAGVPPLAGFFGKYFVLLAAVKAGLWPLALIGVLASVVAAGYYLRIVKIMYFDKGSGSVLTSPRSYAHNCGLALATLFVVLFVLWPSPVIEGAHQAVERLLVP